MGEQLQCCPTCKSTERGRRAVGYMTCIGWISDSVHGHEQCPDPWHNHTTFGLLVLKTKERLSQ